MIVSMRLFKKRGIYYAEFSRGQRRSLKTKDAVQARQIFNALRKEYLSGRLREIVGQCDKRISDYATEYLSWAIETQPTATYKANRLALAKLKNIAEDCLLDKISTKHIDMLVAESKRNGLKGSSINNYIRHMRAALNKAVEWGYIKTNPLSSVKEIAVTNSIPHYLRKDQISTLLSKADKSIRLFIAAYIATGRRRQELFNLKWEDIDLDRGVYLVRKSKTYLAKEYPISATFRSILGAITERQGRVFKQFKHPDTITHKVKEALCAAGLHDFRLHDLRHTFASLFVEAGGNLRTLQDLMGHSEYRTTEIYAHISDSHTKEEIDRVKLLIEV